MYLAGYSYSFFRQLEAGTIDTTATISFFADVGLPSIELADVYIPEDEHPRLRAELARHRLAVACYDLHCDFVTPDPVARERQVAKVQRGLERAVEYGAPCVLVVPGASREDVADADARRWFADGLIACREQARQLGVTMTVPNLGYQAALFGASAHLLEARDRVGPDLGVTYDVGNYLMAGEDTLAALDQVGSLVRHVHLKDWRIAPPSGDCLDQGGYPGLDGRCYHGVALGDGIVDLFGALARLKRLGYRGALSVEYEGTGDPRDATRRGVAYARSVLDRLEAERS
jgi:sugar phosphate isomerase/epimerase